MAWFMDKSFKWMNKPECSKCNNSDNMELTEKSGEPTEEDLKWGASRVEHYKCSKCSQVERFARYNNPLKLFETKTGRCGEWANAFTCLCVTLGHEARLVLDWTDHVWTEVYIDSEKRWVHLDSGENYWDAPLTYEKGWSK